MGVTCMHFRNTSRQRNQRRTSIIEMSNHSSRTEQGLGVKVQDLFVFEHNEKGRFVQEMHREAICDVRCDGTSIRAFEEEWVCLIYSCVDGGIDDVLGGKVNGCNCTVQAERGNLNG